MFVLYLLFLGLGAGGLGGGGLGAAGLGTGRDQGAGGLGAGIGYTPGGQWFPILCN